MLKTIKKLMERYPHKERKIFSGSGCWIFPDGYCNSLHKDGTTKQSAKTW